MKPNVKTPKVKCRICNSKSETPKVKSSDHFRLGDITKGESKLGDMVKSETPKVIKGKVMGFESEEYFS